MSRAVSNLVPEIIKYLTVFLLSSGVLFAQPSVAQVDRQTQQKHQINLNDVEMADLIEDVSILTGYTFLVHPQVRGRVTVTSQTPLTTAEVFEVFLSTLRVHQFVAIPSGNRTYKIVPEQTAPSSAGLLTRGTDAEGFVTQIFKLNYFSAVEAAQMVKPVVNPSGQVVANKNSNTLVVVDYASNLARIRQIVSDLDEDKSLIRTVPLKNVPAREMEAILNGLNDEYAMNIKAVSAETSNAIVIRGAEMGVTRAMQVARDLDSTERVRDNIRVIPLNNAKAADIAPVLERLSTAIKEQGDAGATSRPATIASHEQTNSLVISADYETLNALERVITALDVRRPQVMVEALVAEVSDNTARELGVQFVVSGTDGNIPFASTNFSRSAPNMLALTGALAGGSDFLSGSSGNDFQSAAISSLLALDGLTLGGGGVSGKTLFGVIVSAVDSDVASNILSTPMLMAVDNETSSIIVGQEVPVTTGSAVGSDLTNAFVTIERKDVGVQLDVTPQIGEGDSVKLTIFQEASNIAGDVSGEIVTNKRSITTSVIADDGEIIVLGGLVEQTSSFSEAKVPFLGDIPGVGNLFKSTGRTNARTNLMVFIRPTIIRDSNDARMTTAQKYRYIRAQEMMKSESDVSTIDAFIEELMGTQAPVK